MKKKTPAGVFLHIWSIQTMIIFHMKYYHLDQQIMRNTREKSNEVIYVQFDTRIGQPGIKK